ncbi:PREDICTED: arrestin domain-containing protein 1 [Lipotes vexillifer]|uniref:Arrestin domain-containing protein 1 n=1 Tax=Lipotes vexillifer TaxID=118797 RepID=A0A340XG55_LIPVE|nr:PREDICTED: arrestin domain-containing protein 1 [Lipotes vexillifer]
MLSTSGNEPMEEKELSHSLKRSLRAYSGCSRGGKEQEELDSAKTVVMLGECGEAPSTFSKPGTAFSLRDSRICPRIRPWAKRSPPRHKPILETSRSVETLPGGDPGAEPERGRRPGPPPPQLEFGVGRGVLSGDRPRLGLVQPWPSDRSGLWTEEFEFLITGRKAAATLLPAIRVACTGSCKVSSKANDTAWAAEEGYFNSALSLADKGSLPAGEHSFPFQFLLPATAPTSFEGPFGKIVHQVRATIDTPRFSKDHQCSHVFYILSPLNLNSIPDIEQPNVASITKKFSYKLVKTGSVVLTASTDLRGYVVGQVLRLQADIENQSGKDTSPVVASLLQKVSYKAKRWIYDVRTIAEVEGAGVKAWRRAQWQEQILVPALPQSALPGCSLIHVDYYLQVSLKTPEAIVTLPVFIGNIAVNHVPLSPRPGQGLVVPSAPPQEEAEAVAGGPHFFSDPVSLSTKSHSQQQQPPAALDSVPGAPEPHPQDGSPAPHPLPPPLCISTGATVPYFAEGSGGPVPTTSTLILPPEYTSWGYPYEAPPSYEQSCGGVDPGLTPGS